MTSLISALVTALIASAPSTPSDWGSAYQTTLDRLAPVPSSPHGLEPGVQWCAWVRVTRPEGQDVWARLCKSKDGASIVARTIPSDLEGILFEAAENGKDVDAVAGALSSRSMERTRGNWHPLARLLREFERLEWKVSHQSPAVIHGVVIYFAYESAGQDWLNLEIRSLGSSEKATELEAWIYRLADSCERELERQNQ